MARVKKTEKKKWFLLVAPKIFHSQVVGEILLLNPSDAIGRVVPVNLANLAKDPRRQHITIKLKASNVAGEKIHTEPIGYQMSPSYIKKMVRKRGAKVDYSFTAEAADNQNLRLKVIILARRSTNLSVKTALRKKAEEILGKECKKRNFVELMQEIVAHKLQGDIKRMLNKITPLKSFEVRYLGIEKVKKYESKPAAKEKPSVEKEEVKKEEAPEEKPKIETKEEVKKEEMPKEEKSEEKEA